MARARYQATKTRYRSQVVDPTTGHRLSIRAGSLSELESRQRRVRDARDGLRYGDISVREAQGKLRPAVGMATTVRALWERYTAGLGSSTLRVAKAAWAHQIEPWLGKLSVWDLSESTMRAWRTDLERVRRPGKSGARGYAPKTRRLAFDLLRGALSLAIRDGVLSEYPWGAFTVPNPRFPQKERETLRDPAELVALLSAARQWDLERGRALDGRFPAIAVLCLTGLRQAEACGLGWDDVDLEREPYTLTIRKQARRGWNRETETPERSPKGGHQRTQTLHPNVVAALRYHRRQLFDLGRYSENGPVFPRPGTGLWRTSGVVLSPRAFRDVVRLAGLPNPERWTTHSTRHSFSRLELIGHGGDLRTVAERTGHRDLSVLEGYLRQAARGGSGSKIPELPHSLGPPAIEAHGETLPDTERGFSVLGVRPYALPALPAPSLEVPKPADPDSWTAIGQIWALGGRKPKTRPRAISLALKGIYSRAYARELYRSSDPGKARAAGARAKRAALGAWAKILAGLLGEP